MVTIHKWEDLKDQFGQTLVIGNGASIACSPRFKYSSLLDEARQQSLISPVLDQVFGLLNTQDFELVLRELWTTYRIAKTLGSKDRSAICAYEEIRDVLMKTIHAIHPAPSDIEQHLKNISDFMGQFNTVLSLNYDLIIYWALMAANDRTRNRFKDCFTENNYEEDHEWLSEPFGNNDKATLVFYPHGSLSLVATLNQEGKITRTQSPLLDTIERYWRRSTPILVTEGNSQQKIDAIRRSAYLRSVFRTEVRRPGESLVIYGWSIGDADEHIQRAVFRPESKMERVAVGLHLPSIGNPNLALNVSTIQHKIQSQNPKITVRFFDAESPGAWIH